jgi:peroxiredoxin
MEINMARTPSVMVELGTKAPDFSLPDISGKNISLQDFANAPGLLVMFISNHCPYVKWIRKELANVTSKYMQRGLGVVAIMSNDVVNYPDDSPANMQIEANEAGYKFYYLYDETQNVARAYQAACTPDFFLFDHNQRLVYRGQFDDSRPGSATTVTGNDLSKAVDCLLSKQPITTQQKASLGCNIKWKTV